MIESLIIVLIAALVIYLVYWFVGKLVTGVPYQIIGIVLALVFLLFCLRQFGIWRG